MNEHHPSLIDSLVIEIIGKMPFKDRVSIANYFDEEDDIYALEVTLGDYLDSRIEQLDEREHQRLMKECKTVTGKKFSYEIDATTVILREAWKRLKETHKLRIVK